MQKIMDERGEMMQDKETVIKALRCTTELDAEHGCEDCPYHTRESDETIAEFRKKWNMPEDKDIEYMFWYCNTERMMLDAADLLEASKE